MPFNQRQTIREQDTQTRFLCSCDLDLDLDLMTLIYELDLKILKTYPQTEK